MANVATSKDRDPIVIERKELTIAIEGFCDDERPTCFQILKKRSWQPFPLEFGGQRFYGGTIMVVKICLL